MMMRIPVYLGLAILITACSDDGQDEGHVWQEQTDSIQKAEDVNELMKETDQQRRKAIEEQSQ